MGCCQSSANLSSPYDDHQPPNSRSCINNGSRSQSQSAIPRPSTNHSNSPPALAPSGTQFASQHPDATDGQNIAGLLKLKPPKKWSTRPGQKVWTRETLDKERKEFFDTRVTGRKEIWGALQLAMAELWASNDVDEGLATAQTYLNAAEIKTLDGDLSKVLYDQFGNMYELPKHIVSDPQNLQASPAQADADDTKESRDGEDEIEEAEDEETIQRRREDKGKGVLRESDMMKVKVRFSVSGIPDRTISFSKKERVRTVCQQIVSEVPQLVPPKVIKLCFLGKALSEDTVLGKDLEETRARLEAFKDNDAIVVNAMVLS